MRHRSLVLGLCLLLLSACANQEERADQKPKAVQEKRRILNAWTAQQATGEPNSGEVVGHFPTAWASETEDGQVEWLSLEYAQPVTVSNVVVYETYNPGAIIRVTSIDDRGAETQIWAGKDPGTITNRKNIAVVSLAVSRKVTTKRIKLYLASQLIRGRNDVDAVGVRDDHGTLFWATKADASSTQNDDAASGQ